MMGEILVTGADGLLGSEFKRKIPEAVFCSRREIDVTNIDSIHRFIQNRNIRFIINCAANCNAEYLEDHPEESILINEKAPENLANISNEIGATLIHFSSDYVFDGKKSVPYVETDLTNPLSIYGKSKVKSEQYLLKNCDSVLIFRTAWLFSEYGRDFVKTIRTLGSREDLRVIFDQVGSPSYAGDIAEHVVKILPKIEYGIKEVYHLTNEGVCSWYDLAHLILKEFELDHRVIPVHTEEYFQKAKRPAYSVLDKKKVKRDFGLDIRHFAEALHECIARIKMQ